MWLLSNVCVRGRNAVTAAGISHSFVELTFTKSLPCIKPCVGDAAITNITGIVSVVTEPSREEK